MAEQREGKYRAKTVLVVEDEPTVRMPLVRMLRTRGYTVLEAANGPEALRIAGEQTSPVDCVVTDVMMPDMKGPELIEALRSTSPDTCVVFISGLPANLAGVDYEGIPRSTFLTKPFSLGALADRVREMLGA